MCLAASAYAQDEYLDEAVVESVQAIRRSVPVAEDRARCRALLPEASSSAPRPGFLRHQREGASLSQAMRWVATAAAVAPAVGDCTLPPADEQTIYLVRYRYRGELYQVRMPTDPGSTLKVRVQLTPEPATAQAVALP
jgi:hypothetical protein